MGEIAIGDLFKHKKYGFIGELTCVDYSTHIHLIQSVDNREPKYCYHSHGLYDLVEYSPYNRVEYPPTLTWKGLEYQIEDDFEKYIKPKD